MSRCLEMLYDVVDDEQAKAMLLDPDRRADVYAELAPDLASYGIPEGIFASREGEALGVAMVALRLRFPRDVGLEKVELNIAMREGRA